MDTPGKIFHVNLLGYSYWCIFIRVSQSKDHCVLVDQARYATSVVEKYIDTATIKKTSNFNNAPLPNDMIFTKEYASTID